MPADVDVDVPAAVARLARPLRSPGVDPTSDRLAAAVEALALRDPTSRDDVYWAGRVAFCASPDDIARYDRVFAAVFDGREGARYDGGTEPALRVVPPVVLGGESGSDEPYDGKPAAASRIEILRTRDLADLDGAERAEALA